MNNRQSLSIVGFYRVIAHCFDECNYPGIAWKEAILLTEQLFDVIANIANQSPAFNM